METKVSELCHSQIKVINIGLELFYDSLEKQGTPVIQVQWRPPLGGDERLAEIIRKMKDY